MQREARAVVTPAESFDIVVVGGGPVGLTVAIDLARHGLRPLLLEAKESVSWSSRAICISRRSQEIFERLGVGPAFAAKALRWSSGRTFNRDELVFRLEMPCSSADRHAPFINLQQFHTERFLLDGLQALGSSAADVRWGHCVTGVVPSQDHVELAVSSADSTYHVRAKWVVAADGGRSPLRESLGLRLCGSSYEGRYLIADIEVRDVVWPVERHVWFDPVSNPGSTVILHVQPDGIWRIDIQLAQNDDSDEVLEHARLIPRLQAQLDMMGVQASWKLVWASVYRAHALTLDDYRHGRVLFAGDAAHLVPIFGVRGLNSGIDDAHNLGWKLDLVMRELAPQTLLDSYTAERLRATHENLAAATKSTWFMSPPSDGFRLMRDTILSLANQHSWASALLNPRQSAAHVYDASPIIVEDNLACGVVPGAVLPNVPVAKPAGGSTQELHLHDALAPVGFTVLLFADEIEPGHLGAVLESLPPSMAAVVVTARPAAWAISTDILLDRDGALTNLFAAATFPVYLVRPDEHVAARLRADAPEELLSALHAATGRAAIAQSEVRRARPISTQSSALERIFEALASGVDASAPSDSRAFLARLCMLLAYEVDDPTTVLDLVAQAAPVANPCAH